MPPGAGTCLIDPATIPKYVTPLIIPPVMPPVAAAGKKTKDGAANIYQIAVRQFQQQILPDGYGKTTVWSYGSALDPRKGNKANATFNYPAYTIETRTNEIDRVQWVNDLVDDKGNYLPHLLTGAVDQTLHWANPPMDCIMGDPRTDCRGQNPEPYTGPVPIVTHLHGAHVDAISDGYPEAWWLPKAKNIPPGYARYGSNYGSVIPAPAGSAWYEYDNSQRATTLWYHDHSLGMTRLNVYAGPAGFWLIRDAAEDALNLPGPAPVAGESVADLNTVGNPVREKIREIPIVIQGRSFQANGELFYPHNRAFFQEVPFDALNISFIPDDSLSGIPSDVSPIWDPEAFFNTMVVNGKTWPVMEVEPDLYRFRFLNGTDARFLILKLVNSDHLMDPRPVTPDLTFTQIGSDGGLLPEPVALDQILISPAERFDVIVDFRGLSPGDDIYMINEGPDSPFGGGTVGVDFDPSDPATTGQVMKFHVVEDTDLGEQFTAVPTLPDFTPLGQPDGTRQVSLNEEVSSAVCVVTLESGAIVEIPVDETAGDTFEAQCVNTVPVIDGNIVAGPDVFGPIAALLGTVDGAGTPHAKKWAEAITETPLLGTTEEWDIQNFTEDAHPIHVHLVQFQVIGREVRGDPTATSLAGSNDPLPWETGFIDTVIAYPGETTKIKMKFDKPGLYVWHCHIIEHEDNEMMRPYFIKAAEDTPVPLP